MQCQACQADLSLCSGVCRGGGHLHAALHRGRQRRCRGSRCLRVRSRGPQGRHGRSARAGARPGSRAAGEPSPTALSRQALAWLLGGRCCSGSHKGNCPACAHSTLAQISVGCSLRSHRCRLHQCRVERPLRRRLLFLGSRLLLAPAALSPPAPGEAVTMRIVASLLSYASEPLQMSCNWPLSMAVGRHGHLCDCTTPHLIICCLSYLRAVL